MASVTYYVVVVFDRVDGDLRPGEPQEVPSAEAARSNGRGFRTHPG